MNDNQRSDPSMITQDQNNSVDENQVTVMMNLENLIKSHITGIETRHDQLKKHKEMLDDILSNDATYKLHSEKAKEANKLKSNTKAQIMQRPDTTDLSHKIKDFSIEIKEMNSALSDYLREYGRISGTNEITGDDGEVRDIVYVAKLVKRNSKKAK